MMQREGKLNIGEACDLARVSRAGFYRKYEEHEPRQAEMELRDEIQRIGLEHRCYGYRRVTAELRRRGIEVNHKRVLRILREDNLLSLRKRRFVLTTNSKHSYWVYPNLAARLVVSGSNQLWVADITYIRLREQFIYLAVILDAWSRRIVGWALNDTLEANLAIQALDRAMADRTFAPGIVHHSDRGVQYCSNEYVKRLESHGFSISMSRAGNPYDNARAESFMKTLKCEEVYLKKYRDREEARNSIQYFLEEVYNRQRLHSSLGYFSPVDFEGLAGPLPPAPPQSEGQSK